jgi:hypothetical protein
MKKFITGLFLILSMTAFSQSSWEKNSNELTINSNTLFKHTMRGMLYGAAGYGAGMWISGNKTEWGLVGSVVTATLPLIVDGRAWKEPEALIGRLGGSIGIGVGFTYIIGKTTRDKPSWTLHPMIRRGY